MKYFVRSALLVTAIALMASPACAGQKSRYVPFLTRGDTSVTVTAGVRNNNFDWNIASDITGTATPNILSELSWKDIKVFEGTAKIEHNRPVYIPFLTGSVHLEGTLKAGQTFSGDNQDSDYLGDNRTQEFSRSNNSSDEGHSYGASAAIGYSFDISSTFSRRAAPQSYLSITPLVGYSWNRQLYKMQDGFQTIPAFGSFAGLDSEYQADWFGPFLGLEAEWQKARHLVKLRGEFHQLDYEAEAIWNLRDDFMQDPSYTHTADGDGYRIDAEYAYAFDQNYVLTVNGEYEQRTAEDGIDTTYFSNGNSGSIKLNEVNDKSTALRIGARYHW